MELNPVHLPMSLILMPGYIMSSDVLSKDLSIRLLDECVDKIDKRKSKDLYPTLNR